MKHKLIITMLLGIFLLVTQAQDVAACSRCRNNCKRQKIMRQTSRMRPVIIVQPRIFRAPVQCRHRRCRG